MTAAALRQSPSTAAASVRTCPICRADDATALHRQRYALFDDSDLPRETTIVACGGCGMVYAASNARAEDYRRHYARHSKYDTAVMVSGSGEAATDARRLDDLVRFLTQHVAALASHDAAILDIGSGRGGLPSAFVGHGYDRVVGIDPSSGCVASMRAIGLAAEVGELEQAEWPTDPGRFDLVVLSHVLEHVFDVAGGFARVAQRVAPHGAIYIEVPDASRYTTQRFPPFYFFDPEHINHFDGPLLDRLASGQGWEIVATWPRVLDLDGGQRYPAIGVVLQRATPVAKPRPAETSGASAIARYVDASRLAVDRSVDGVAIARLATDATPIVVWGAGSHAQRLLAQSALAHCSIACIIDSDPGKQGRDLSGHRVVSSEAGLACAEERGATIVVAIAVGADLVVELIRRGRPAVPVVCL